MSDTQTLHSKLDPQFMPLAQQCERCPCKATPQQLQNKRNSFAVFFSSDLTRPPPVSLTHIERSSVAERNLKERQRQRSDNDNGQRERDNGRQFLVAQIFPIPEDYTAKL